MRFVDYKLHHGAQLDRLGLGVELHPGLLQYPRLYALMVHAQKVKRAHAVRRS